MKVLLIGGSGFIGTRLIGQLLEDGHEVVNLDLTASARYPELSVIGDIQQVADIKGAAAGCQAIINLAAEHRDDVRPLSRYEAVNVGGTASVIAAAEALDIRTIVFTSSVAVYGLDKVNPSESSPVEPFNEYGRTKYAAEQLLREWVAADATRSLAIIRPSVVFGEDNRGNVYTLARQIASGRFVFIGKGANRKSMSYVGNIALFLASQLDVGPGEHLTNYADKPDLTTRELVDLVRGTLGDKARRHLSLPKPVGMLGGYGFDLLAKILRRNLPISSIRVKKFCAETTVDTTRLAATGFRARYTLAEALRRTVTAEFIDRDGLSDAPVTDSGSEG